MTATMKDLEARIELLEKWAADHSVDGHRAGVENEADQEAADKLLLSRFANTRDEAMAQEAARERQTARDKSATTSKATETKD